MPILHRGPKPRPPGLSGSTPEPRPKIWVEGRQQPRFDLRAWARVSLTITRRNLAPMLDDGAASTLRYGQSVLAGERRPDLGWMGRGAALVPSHQSVGNGLAAASRLLSDAREKVLPSPLPDDPIAYPNLIRPDFAQSLVPPGVAPVRLPRPRLADRSDKLAAPGDEPTLRSIRALITETAGTARPDRRSADAPALQPPSPGPLQRLRRAIAGQIWRTAVAVLALGLTGLCLPYGCVKAAFFHFDGGDLRDWT